MTEWSYARIDRIEFGVVHCVFCKRQLRSGRVTVLHGVAGVEVYSGPDCAKKHVGQPTEQILDLSKLAMMIVLKGESPPADQHVDPAKIKPSKRAARAQFLEADEVAQYLRLRAEHMGGFSGAATAKLRDFHQKLSTDDGLDSHSRRYVERLLAKSKLNNSIYSLHNVELCIAAAYWLRIAIDQTRPDRRDFLSRLLECLQEHWRLSKKQVDAINSWGDGVRKVYKDFPVLDSLVFDGVQAPRFAADQNKAS
jgi:hypothetical protein